jgi:hypothetical protein
VNNLSLDLINETLVSRCHGNAATVTVAARQWQWQCKLELPLAVTHWQRQILQLECDRDDSELLTTLSFGNRWLHATDDSDYDGLKLTLPPNPRLR